MSANAAIVMILIGTFVWGGFVLILLAAVRKERHKAGAPAGAAHPMGRGGRARDPGRPGRDAS